MSQIKVAIQFTMEEKTVIVVESINEMAYDRVFNYSKMITKIF